MNNVNSDQTVAVIEEDIPCKRCGYNVRGLTRYDRCPECNELVLTSIYKNAYRRRHLYEADSKWLGEIFEGLLLLIISGLLMASMPFLPPSLYALKSNGRVGMLVLAATWWVLAYFGVWKLAALERGRPMSNRVIWLYRGIRAGSVITVLLPAIPTSLPSGLLTIGFVLCLGLIYLVTIGFTLVTIAQLWHRDGPRIMVIFVCVIVALTLMTTFTGCLENRGHGDESSLARMMGASHPILSSPYLVREVSYNLPNRNYTPPLFALVILMSLVLWTIVLPATLLKVGRASRKSSSAGNMT